MRQGAMIGRRDASGLLLGLLAGAAGALAKPKPEALTVAAYPAVDAIVKAQIPSWQRQHPEVGIRVVSRQFNDHHTAMTTALSTASYLPDVMALEVGYVGRFAQGGGLEVLSRPPYNAQALQGQFVPYAWQQATRRPAGGPGGAGGTGGTGGISEVIAVPSDIGPGTLLYRTDLLAQAGLDEAALTRSWEGYVAAGATLRAKTGAYLMAHARDMKDILIRVGVQQGEGLYFDQDSNVLVDSPRFARAFALARAVRQQRLDAKVLAWSNEWAEGFRRGTLATQISGAWLAGHLANWLAPGTKGLWRAAPLPEQAFAAYGGTFFAIPRRVPAERKPLAWALIQQLTLERDAQLAAFRAHDAFPALRSALDDPYFEQPLPFLGGQPARLLWRDAASRITAVDVHKQDAFASEVIDTELDKVLDRDKPIPQALADAARLLRRRAHR